MSGDHAPFASTSKHLPSTVPLVPYPDEPPPAPPKPPSMSLPCPQPPTSPTSAAPLPAQNGSPGPSSPSSSSMAPSRSWQRLTPQSTFVNGRGNVQQAAAATHYVPPVGANGSPVLGAPVQQQGQQAYVRRESPPVSSQRGSEGGPVQLDGAGETAAVFLPNQFGVRQRIAIKTSSRPPAPRSTMTGQRRSSAMSLSHSSEGQGGAQPPPTMNGSPSPFDENGRAPPQYPRSTMSSRSTSLQAPSPYGPAPVSGSTTPTTARSPSPAPSARSGTGSVLDRPRPRLTDPYDSTASTFASRHAGGSHSPQPSAPASSSHMSPSSSTNSILDRPRPRTPDAAASLGLAPSRSTSPTVYRSSYASSNGGGSGSVTPTPSGAPPAPKVSVLDRPRPKTPETTALFRFGEGGAVSTGAGPRPRTPDAGSVFRYGVEGGSTSVLDRPRPKTPDSSSVFAFAAPEVEGAASVEQRQEEATKEEPRLAKQSVMDRPRPRTPDSQAWLDGASAIRPSKPPFAFGSGPSSAPLGARFAAAHHHRPTGSNTTTSGFSSSQGGSFDSLGPTTLSASTATSTNATSVRPSFDSASTSTRDAPLLDFNFDFGSSFGSTETMFGLSDLLKFGTSSGDRVMAPSATADAKAPPAAAPTQLAAATPARAPESVPHTRTPSSTSSTGTSGFLNLPGGSAGATGRTTPRKEPPKVDLKLELELEMERAIPPNRPLVSDVSRASIGSSAGTDDDRGKRQRMGRDHASISSISSTAASGRSASVSGGSVFSMGLNGAGAQGSSPRPKRRRRRSLASLLSLGSFSQSGHAGEVEEGKSIQREEMAEREAELARKVPLAPPILPPVAHAAPLTDGDSASATSAAPPSAPYGSTHVGETLIPPFGDLSLDKSLPPTPLGGPSPLPLDYTGEASSTMPEQPDSPSKRSFGAAVGAANKGLTRQLSRLRSRGGSSSSGSDARSRNPSFQVISATTTRRPSGQQERKSSITSLSTADTHASRKDSLDYGRYTAAAPLAPAAFPASGPPPCAMPAPPAASVPFGRRLVDRFIKGSGSRQATTAPAAPSNDTWMMPVRDHSDESAPPPRMGKRRASLSSLLGVGSASASADGHGAPSSSGPKKILGMSLPAGRKSDDLLASGRMRGSERDERSGPWGAFPDAQRVPEFGGRRSFDILTERAAIPRRPSTDDLLTLASAKLSSMAIASETANVSTASPSAQSSTVETGQISSVTSGTSTPVDKSGEKASAIIATAAVVNPANGIPVAPIAESESPAVEQRTVAPVLVRSDSIKGGPRRPIEISPDLPSTSTALASQSVPSRARPPALVTAPPLPPAAEPIWRMTQLRAAPPSTLATRMTRPWLELEDALRAYAVLLQDHRSDRAAIVNNVLMPFLRQEEARPGPGAVVSLAHRHRDILFGWIDVLMTELTEVQATHRGTCLEAVAAIAESHLLSSAALHNYPEAQRQYRLAIVRMLDFAVEKLNAKAVYANILAFSSRVFALAFFRVEGIAVKLLRALPPVKRLGMKRILEEAGVDPTNLPPADSNLFPEHLSDLCLRDLRTYASLLLGPQVPTEDSKYLVREGDVAIELTGNWLVRWRASDSDLPFAFYRAYHRQLASHLIPLKMRAGVPALEPIAPSAVVTAPGFLLIAASLLDKIDSLVHRSMRAVTSIGVHAGNFNTNDSANLSFGQKPKVLELAQRRIVQTLVDIVGGPPSALIGGEGAFDAVTRRYAYGGMLQVWIRACVKRTSLWDVRGVYLLSDLIEGLMYTLAYSTVPRADDEDDEPPTPDERGVRLFDLSFLFSTVRLILEQADNTVTIMRAIALLYSNFDAFTLREADRTELCEKLILDEKLFQRLLLHYNSGVRGFWIRLLVWRVSRLGKAAQERDPNRRPDEGIVALFSLLNVRLEAVRKRHDQLEPMDSLSDDNAFFRPKRSTICSTRGVKEAPWTVDALGGPLEEESDEEDTQELVRSVPPPSLTANGGRKNDLKTVAKVVSWLKGGLGKKQGKGSKALPDEARADPFLLERSNTVRTGKSIDGASIASADSKTSPTVLPTTVETGLVPSRSSRGPTTSAAPTQNTRFSPPASPNRPRGPQRQKSSRSEKRRSLNPAFFAFEFENGVVTRTDVDPTVASSGASVASVTTTGSGDTSFPTSPIRARHGDGPAALSPRVSLRFSKRISILPPAALDLLREAHGSEPVPPIPARFRDSVIAGYDKKLHPYAVRGLRDYEDALDEWTDWVANLEDEEGENRGFVDVVPRLAVSWPLSASND